MENQLQSTTPDSDLDLTAEHRPVMDKIAELYRDLFLHDGYGTLRVEMRFLKKGQKEIVVICGKEFRFVVDYPEDCRQGR
jgi:hypothetical protein